MVEYNSYYWVIAIKFILVKGLNKFANYSTYEVIGFALVLNFNTHVHFNQDKKNTTNFKLAIKNLGIIVVKFDTKVDKDWYYIKAKELFEVYIKFTKVINYITMSHGV